MGAGGCDGSAGRACGSTAAPSNEAPAAQSGYDGSTFARDGIVFVSANYRLGAEGFSVLDGAPLNLGLRDAQLALEWVHREVAAFGGDPARITIMGESAGGALVAALLAQPAARARVAGAIIESGPLDAVEPGKARRASDALAKKLKIHATRDGFWAAAPGELLAARSEIAAGASPLGGTPGVHARRGSGIAPGIPRGGARRRRCADPDRHERR